MSIKEIEVIIGTFSCCLLAGILTGILFHGGLLITLQHLRTAANPAFIGVLSFIIRNVLIVTFLFILIRMHHIYYLIAAGVGFLAGKSAITLIRLILNKARYPRTTVRLNYKRTAPISS